ncbi:PKD domain-containing protein [Aliikangiella sp. IMCC44359]|uniref:PKD domain-containing protein n=1 Tax=Aliikangiella sp. IMCC44359 TaxID=3459125 RepID=UPI00403A8020
MLFERSLVLLCATAIVTLLGCGGSGSDTELPQETPQNSAPIAQIMSTNQATVEEKIQLDGSNSQDADNDQLTYNWTLTVPQESTATLENTTSQNTYFTPDVAGSYQVNLIVNDGTIDSSAATKTIMISSAPQENTAPVAMIISPDEALVGENLLLDASNSTDTDGDSLKYQWALTVPPTSAANLENSSDEKTNFTPDVSGNYQISLIVNDGSLNSDEVSKTIIIKEAPAGQKISLQSQAATSQSVVPFTFATVFKKGEYLLDKNFRLQLENGDSIPLQKDLKAQHNDNTTIRHAIFSGLIPSIAANSAMNGELVESTQPLADTGISLTDLINHNWDMTIEVSIDNKLYTLSANSLLSKQTPTQWLKGKLANEWIVSGALLNSSNEPHQQLSAQLAIRVYGDFDNIRTSVTIENSSAYTPSPQNITYSVVIKQNNSIVYQNNQINHLKNARWRQLFWQKETPQLHITHDASYLISTGAIPNYDPQLIDQINPTVIEQYRTDWTSELITIEVDDNGYYVPIGSGGTQFTYDKIGPMGIGFANPAMGTTGARPDIGPLPQWTALYILDQSALTKSIMLNMGQLAGSWPIHYRNKQTNLPLSIDDFPYASSHPDKSLTKNPNTNQYEQVAQCDSTIKADCLSPYRPDTSHQPSQAYVPYLITGDYYFLEELHFWTTYNFLSMNPHYRSFEKGLFEKDLQDRAQAWSMRTLGHAAYITPDTHPLKAHYNNKIATNLDKYREKYLVNEPNPYGSMIPNYSHPTHSPWMDDFFTWAISHLVDLDFSNTQELLNYKAKFSVQRMGFGVDGGSGYCWIFSSAYHILIAPEKDAPMFESIAEVYENTNGKTIPYDGGFFDHNLECGSQAQADALGLELGEMIGYSSSPTGFPSNLQIALAAAKNSGINGSSEAWQKFMNRGVKPDYSGYPNYAIVPRK